MTPTERERLLALLAKAERLGDRAAVAILRGRLGLR